MYLMPGCQNSWKLCEFGRILWRQRAQIVWLWFFRQHVADTKVNWKLIKKFMSIMCLCEICVCICSVLECGSEVYKAGKWVFQVVDALHDQDRDRSLYFSANSEDDMRVRLCCFIMLTYWLLTIIMIIFPLEH